MADALIAYRPAAVLASVGTRILAPSSAVENGMKTIAIKRSKLKNSRGRSRRAMRSNKPWWFIHITPIVRKLATYAAYFGQAASKAASNPPGALLSIVILKINRVAATAKTPALNAPTRPFLMALQAEPAAT